MLEITVPATELYDNEKNEFIYVKKTTLRLEHSLVSLSRWESKWKKPFLSSGIRPNTEDITIDEAMDYIRCMTINQGVDPNVYKCIPNREAEIITEYIEDPHTATTVGGSNHEARPSRVVTSELLYAWMVMLNIPHDYDKWHLNRLITLIRVIQEENNPNKQKLTQSQRRALNNARNAAAHTPKVPRKYR